MANTLAFIFSWQIFCAKCGAKDLRADNDIILCDGACERAFHQFCLEPPLLKQDSMSKLVSSILLVLIFCLLSSLFLFLFLSVPFFSSNYFPPGLQFLLMMRAGFALDVIVRLTALTCLMTLKELIFLFWISGRSTTSSQSLHFSLVTI